MITLIPMTQPEFERYLVYLTDAYAQDQIKAGVWQADTATEQAAASLSRDLPNGLATPNHFIYNVRDAAIPEPVGHLWIGISPESDTPVFIMDIEIFSAYQRRGYAQQTLQAVEAIAAERGLSTIGLHVHANNHGAQALYEKTGFVTTGHQMRKHVLAVDEALVRRSIALSAAAAAHGNEPFGALLARDGQIILEIENSVYSEHNVTNHAETNLVRRAVEQYDAAFLSGCVLYTSTEPCAMCSGAIYWSGIGAVVFACSEKRLSDFSGLALSVPCRSILGSGTHEIRVVGPVLEEEAATIHAGYWRRNP